MYKSIGEFVITKKKKQAFKSGELWKEWVEHYPFLFDEIDRGYFETQSKYGYGLVEALAAIFVYLSTGYISIAGSYCYENQAEKRDIVKGWVSLETWELINQTHEYHSQPPDLFIYSPASKDYFFCEVKGPGDKIRDSQDKYFARLEEISGRPVYQITFMNAPFDK
jgi:hypothetical protein